MYRMRTRLVFPEHSFYSTAYTMGGLAFQHSNTPTYATMADNNENFPGYPSYGPGEDITADNNNSGKVALDSSTGLPTSANANEMPRSADTDLASRPDDAAAAADADGDVTAEEIQMLSAAEQSRDLDDVDLEEPLLDNVDDDGDPLNEPQGSYASAGADLDVPGSEDDDNMENIGEEDEENNYYSIGSDNSDRLEDDNTQR